MFYVFFVVASESIDDVCWTYGRPVSDVYIRIYDPRAVRMGVCMCVCVRCAVDVCYSHGVVYWRVTAF
jgi:hypothetical protein